MNRENIILMARESYYKYMDWANRDDPWRREFGSKYYEDQAIERAALAAAAAEREECAKVIEDAAYPLDHRYMLHGRLAEAIRARGNTPCQ